MSKGYSGYSAISPQNQISSICLNSLPPSTDPLYQETPKSTFSKAMKSCPKKKIPNFKELLQEENLYLITECMWIFEPDNLLVTGNGTIKIGDFSLSQVFELEMGIYLSAPKTEKCSEDGENSRLGYGLSSMQGWRATMEDAHVSKLRPTDFEEWRSFSLVRYPDKFKCDHMLYTLEQDIRHDFEEDIDPD
ncbi:Uncharacterized protein Fot_08295 [Forsythia ovata]|uniref:Protein kinase domain-containing protein n=1 Tax=Forsythia ovata TaxID=205694 RepID=A0ABD1WYK8_9LAMI